MNYYFYLFVGLNLFLLYKINKTKKENQRLLNLVKKIGISESRVKRAYSKLTVEHEKLKANNALEKLKEQGAI